MELITLQALFAMRLLEAFGQSTTTIGSGSVHTKIRLADIVATEAYSVPSSVSILQRTP